MEPLLNYFEKMYELCSALFALRYAGRICSFMILLPAGIVTVTVILIFKRRKRHARGNKAKAGAAKNSRK